MRHVQRWIVAVIALGLILAGCSRTPPAPQPTTGSISGTITRTAVGGGSASAPASVTVEPVAIAPGGVFVVFAGGRPEVQFGTATVADGFTFRQDGGFAFGGVEFQQHRAYPTASGLAFYQADGLSETATRDLVQQMRASRAVVEAFPNWVLEAQQVFPDDEHYELQAWHYEQLNLPEAWDIENGSSIRVPVAVLDTGSFAHPDIEWGVGANFWNWGTADHPGPGNIDDPTQVPGGSAHGTHVAGTIGATTDNGIGVAGVNWNVDVQPVRVLGPAGSGNFDGILEGVFWAAGDDPPWYGTHVNESPAWVINMSLGGNISEACPAVIDEIFETIYEVVGTITVVAAGNDSSPTDVYFPANCPSVITVGSTGPTGERSYFSNFGSQIDVFAPGGDADYDHPVSLNPDHYAGVLSLVEGGYGFSQGTSMASPHVAGVVSLMLAQDPTLSLDEVRERLHNASVPLSTGECNVPLVGFEGQNACGAGLLDAEAALLGQTLTTPRAFAYAIPFDGTAPEVGMAQLGSLSSLATYQVEASSTTGGNFSFSLDDLPPGDYLVVALEQRDPASGVANVDRVGVVEVEVEAGSDSDGTVVVNPIYLGLP